MKALLLINLINFTYASECFNSKSTIIFNHEKKSEDFKICIYSHEKINYLVSESCLDLKCSLLNQKIEGIEIPDRKFNIGSPGFKLCYVLGGVPQIFDYINLSQKNETTDRCLFGKNDFVENSLLIDLWRGVVKIPTKK
jgi:hypothetical protein